METHIVAEPPTDEAYFRAQSNVLNKLSEWLYEERQKVEPMSERWRTLADVTECMHRLQNDEIHPAAVAVDHQAADAGKPATRA